MAIPGAVATTRPILLSLPYPCYYPYYPWGYGGYGFGVYYYGGYDPWYGYGFGYPGGYPVGFSDDGAVR